MTYAVVPYAHCRRCAAAVHINWSVQKHTVLNITEVLASTPSMRFVASLAKATQKEVTDFVHPLMKSGRSPT